jgi:hypothetical protein
MSRARESLAHQLAFPSGACGHAIDQGGAANVSDGRIWRETEGGTETDGNNLIPLRVGKVKALVRAER